MKNIYGIYVLNTLEVKYGFNRFCCVLKYQKLLVDSFVLIKIFYFLIFNLVTGLVNTVQLHIIIKMNASHVVLSNFFVQ